MWVRGVPSNPIAFSQTLSLNSAILMDFKRCEYLEMICSNKYGDIKSMKQHQLGIDVVFVIPTTVPHRARARARFTCIHFWHSTSLQPENESCNHDRRINTPVSSSKDWYAQKNIDKTKKSFDAVQLTVKSFHGGCAIRFLFQHYFAVLYFVLSNYANASTLST